jgi:hypothetical protein
MNRFQDFVDDIGVDWLAETLYLGPQAEVLEKIDRFNSDFRADIGITPKFRWKPGTYDKIKELIMKTVLGWGMRANSTTALIERMDQRAYTKRRLRQCLNDIEIKLQNLRYNNQSFMDNTDTVVEAVEVLKGVITRFEEQFNNIAPDRVGVRIDYIDTYDLDVSRPGDRYRYKIEFSFVIYNHPDTFMNVIFNNEIIQELHLQEITFHTIINLYDVVNGLIQRDLDISRCQHFVNISGWRGNYEGISNDGTCHPFIHLTSRDVIASEDPADNSMCFGDYTSQIDKLFKTFDPSLAVILLDWTSKFTMGATNPWNAINHLHIGYPASLNEAYLNRIDRDVGTCFTKLTHRQELSKIPETCNAIKCTSRHECMGFIGLSEYVKDTDEAYMHIQMIYDLLYHNVDTDPSDQYEPSNLGEYIYDHMTAQRRIVVEDRWYDYVDFSRAQESEETRMSRIFYGHGLIYEEMTNEQRTRAAATLNIRR